MKTAKEAARLSHSAARHAFNSATTPRVVDSHSMLLRDADGTSLLGDDAMTPSSAPAMAFYRPLSRRSSRCQRLHGTNGAGITAARRLSGDMMASAPASERVST